MSAQKASSLREAQQHNGMTTTMIGFPCASTRWDGATVGVCSLPTVVFSGHSEGLIGDITGRQGKGTGARVKGRAVGGELLADALDFDSPAFETRKALEAWLKTQSEAGRARGRGISEDQAGGRSLQGVGAWAARRNAAWLQYHYGVQASATSIEDSRADAVAKLVIVFGSEGAGEALANDTARGELLRVASNAAWNSLRSWAGDGLTGDTSRLPVFKCTSDDVPEQTWHTLISDALAIHATETLRSPGARRAAIRRIYQAGYYSYRRACQRVGMGGRALQQRTGAARQRCRTFARVLLGESLQVASLRAGYKGSRHFLQSCADSDFWTLLGIERPSFRML